MARNIFALLQHPQLNEVFFASLPFPEQLPLRLVSSSVCAAVDDFGEELCKEWVKEYRGSLLTDRIGLPVDWHTNHYHQRLLHQPLRRTLRSARYIHYSATGRPPLWLRVFVVSVLQRRRRNVPSDTCVPIVCHRLKAIWSDLVVLVLQDYLGVYSEGLLDRCLGDSRLGKLTVPMLALVRDHLEESNAVEELHLPGKYGLFSTEMKDDIEALRKLLLESTVKWRKLRFVSAGLNNGALTSFRQLLPALEPIVYAYRKQSDYNPKRLEIVYFGRKSIDVHIPGTQTATPPVPEEVITRLGAEPYTRLRVTACRVNTYPDPIPVIASLGSGPNRACLQSLELRNVLLPARALTVALSPLVSTLGALDVETSLVVGGSIADCVTSIMTLPWKNLRRLVLRSIAAGEPSPALMQDELARLSCHFTGLVDLVTDLPIPALLTSNWPTLEFLELGHNAASTSMFAELLSKPQGLRNKLRKLHMHTPTTTLTANVLFEIFHCNRSTLEELDFELSVEWPTLHEVLRAIAALPAPEILSSAMLRGQAHAKDLDTAKLWRELLGRCSNLEKIAPVKSSFPSLLTSVFFDYQQYVSIPFGLCTSYGKYLRVNPTAYKMLRGSFTAAEWELLSSWKYFPSMLRIEAARAEQERIDVERNPVAEEEDDSWFTA